MVTNWSDFQNNDINTYCENLIEDIHSITKMCIPNKVMSIRPSDPPWVTTLTRLTLESAKELIKGQNKPIFQCTGPNLEICATG